ncbi:MAG: hypothetical protein ABH879_04955 [archaeon]
MTKKRDLLLFFTVFLIGWVSHSVSGHFTSIDLQTPLSLVIFDHKAKEKASPHDRIKEDQIHVYSDRVVIDIDDPQWAGFVDTNSMDPIIDDEANAIEIVPKSAAEVHTGDIVSYRSDLVDGTIIHRVIETGNDGDGWYAIMKGDNNPANDPGKVRFSQIERVVVAVIY